MENSDIMKRFNSIAGIYGYPIVIGNKTVSFPEEYDDIFSSEEVHQLEEMILKKREFPNTEKEPTKEKSEIIKENFIKEFDEWDRKDFRKTFLVATTSNAMRLIGIDDKDITLDAVKLNRIFKYHPSMSDEVIKQLPDLINEPVFILASKQKESRIVAAGEVLDTDNNSVVVIMELRPKGKNGVELDEIKIASAYGKENIQNLMATSNMLYITDDKEKINRWIKCTGLQLPFGSSTIDYSYIISQNDEMATDEFKEKKDKDMLTLEERYTETMKLAGYELIETPSESPVTVTFKNKNTGQTVGFDGWEMVGQELEDLKPLNEEDKERFESLLHPQGRISYYTKNLGGTGLGEDAGIVTHPDFESALNAYMEAQTDGKEIGYVADNWYHQLAYFDMVEMKNVYRNNVDLSDLTQNETKEVLNNNAVLINMLQKDNVYNSLENGFWVLIAGAVVNMTKHNDERGSWLGRVANTHRPQDYIDIDITGYRTQHEVVCEVDVVHANEVVHSKTVSFETDPNNFEESVRSGMNSAVAEYSKYFKEVIDLLDTDIQYPMQDYAPGTEHTLEEHYDRLSKAGYESFPSRDNKIEKENPITLWVGNRRTYAEGNIVGKWIELPMEDTELEEVLSDISNGFKDEVYIGDASFREDCSYLFDASSEYDRVQDVNVVAKLIGDKSHPAVEMYLKYDENLSMTQIANLLLREDDISYFAYDFDGADDPNVLKKLSNEKKVGYAVLERESNLKRSLEELELDGTSIINYVDVEAIGREMILSGYVMAGEDGYFDTRGYTNLEKYSIDEINYRLKINLPPPPKLTDEEFLKGLDRFFTTEDEEVNEEISEDSKNKANIKSNVVEINSFERKNLKKEPTPKGPKI